MKRRIALSLLLFCMTVIAAMLVTTGVVINQDYMSQTRQTMQTACRVLAYMLKDTGAGLDQDWHAVIAPYRAQLHPVPSVVTEKNGGEAVREAYASESGNAWRVHRDTEDVRVMTVAYKMDDGRVIALTAPVTQPEGYRMFNYVAAIFVFVVIIAVLFALYLSASITRPISRLSRAALNFMGGDYNSRVEVRGRDELSSLSESFNDMAEKLQNTITELNAKGEEIDTIINAMLNGFLAVDEQMHVIRINPAAKRLFNVHGNPYGEYILDVTRNAKLEQHLITAMEQAELYTVDMPTRVENANRVVRLYVTGLQKDGVTIGAIALFDDVTQLRRLEQMRFDFVANVTHELKTPLTSIRGFVETLQHGAIEDPDAARRFLSIIAMEAERLTRLIDDILSLSSLEAGRKKEDVRLHPFAPFVQQIMELLRSNAVEKNITLFFEDNSHNATVLANEDKIKQLLINLVDNAIKYTQNDGNVRVNVSKEGNKVVLRVTDSGIGIENEHIPRLFERFYRVDKGRSRNMGGTGLGLAIVKHIVMEMNGSIEVESVPGSGSTFTVYLPVADGEPQSGGETR